LQNLDNELNESQVWQSLKDVDSSPALNYNWTKSESNNVFLASLSIDSRNIVRSTPYFTNDLIVNISVFFLLILDLNMAVVWCFLEPKSP